VVAVGAEPAQVGGPFGDELRPPVGEVRRDLHADARQQPARLAHEQLHVADRHGRGPARHVRQRGLAPFGDIDPGPPQVGGRRFGDLGGLAPVVALVRDEVLQDHLLQVAVLGVGLRERLERGDPLVRALADPDEDPAGERDPQLAGGADRLQAPLWVLRRRALMRDQIRVHGLEHQPLRCRHLAQPAEVLLRQHAEVRVRQQPALQRALARPHDVRHEVVVAVPGQARAHGRVDLGPLAREHQQLLDIAPRGAVQQPLDRVRRVQVRLMGRERAVLAVAPARPRQRQRQVAREGDAAAHPLQSMSPPPRDRGYCRWSTGRSSSRSMGYRTSRL
jgi:hypothetical protein